MKDYHSDLQNLFETLVQDPTAPGSMRLLERQLYHIRLALDKGRVGIWVWDVNSGEMRLDSGLQVLLGYGPDDDCDWEELVHPDDIESLREAGAAYIAGDIPVFDVEHRLQHKDGRALVFLARGDLVVGEEGGRLILGLVAEVTERKRLEEALRRSHECLEARVAERTAEQRLTNERLNLTLDNLDLIAYEIDREGIWTLSRGKGLEKLGRRPDESVGQSLFEHYRDKPKIVEAMHRALQGERQEVENEVGGRIWRATYDPLIGPSGVIERVYGTAVDITEHKEANRRLECEVQEHEVARRRLAGYNEVLHLLAGDTPLNQILEALVRIVEENYSGLVAVVMLTDSHHKRLRVACAPGLPEPFYHLIDGTPVGPGWGACGTAAWSGTRQIVEDIGTSSYCEKVSEGAAAAGLRACWSEPVISPSGQVLGTFALYYRDECRPTAEDRDLVESVASLVGITVERRRSDETVRVNLALQRLRNEILQMKDEGDWEQTNRYFYRELGQLVEFDECGIALVDLEQDRYTVYVTGPNHVLGQSFVGVPERLRQAIETGELLVRRSEDMRADGDDIAPSAGVVVDVPFERGTISLNTKEGMDLGEEHIHILKQFAPVMSEACRRLEVLRRMRESEIQLRQAQKMEAVGQLTAGVAHNFNNLLQGIIAQLYLNMDVEDSERPWIRPTIDTAMRAADLIGKLMQFARTGPGESVERLDLGEVVGRVCEIAQKTFDRRIDVYKRLAPDALVAGDGSQLEQVFLNIMLNARDALEEGRVDKHIWVEMDRIVCNTDIPPQFDGAHPGSYWRVRIADNGCGMDEETRVRVFDPFFTTKDAGRGTGLGLATAYGTVSECGGWLSCKSALDQGTAFDVYLPLSEAPAVHEERVAGEVANPVDGQEKLLLIEDEEIVREGLAEFLGLKGYRVVTAADGAEGLANLERESFDLILLDLSMPNMSGEEVLEHLAGRPERVPVVVFSGYTADIDQHFDIEAVLTKPIVPHELAAALQKVLRSK